jgi:hypothetical protein
MDQKYEYPEEDLQALELEHILLKADPFSKELAHQIERLLEEAGVALRGIMLNHIGLVRVAFRQESPGI